MRKGFFNSSQTQTKTKTITNNPQCAKCKLYLNCVTPKRKPQGTKKIKILHVHSFHDEEGIKYYKQVLNRLGHKTENALSTSACICQTYSEPSKSQISACRPNLLKCIKEFQPHVIIPSGDEALSALLQHKFTKDIGSISKFRGNLIPDREFNAWVCPVFDPNFVLKDKTPESAELIFRDDLKHALRMLDFEFPAFKDEQECVEIIKQPRQAQAYLRDLLKQDSKLIAFDYETSGLKPHRSEQRIASIAFSNKIDHGISFKMFDDEKFLHALKLVLKSKDLKKICANIKFEKDWSEVKLGFQLNGLFFDTMIGSHFLNNIPGITGLKHQVYINFGTPQYNSHIEKLLESTPKEKKQYGGNGLNQIHKIDLQDLLIYGGVDALLEFKLGLLQMDIIGIDYSKYYSGPSGFDICPHIKELRSCK